VELSDAQIARITAYLDATTPLPERADLMFVFGSRWLTPAQLAAQLYHDQRARLVVLTGGGNRYTGQNEANSHWRVLTDAGVPEENIVLENRSTSTLENVTFAIPLIEQKLAMTSIQSVLGICKWMHSRRALMTLKRHFPRGIRYYAHTYEPNGITRENWHMNPRAESANVLDDWERIAAYLQLQQIEEIVREGDCYI
jgi:uncharacterized SAM-binding protein YcdF (DUF218 family)